MLRDFKLFPGDLVWDAWGHLAANSRPILDDLPDKLECRGNNNIKYEFKARKTKGHMFD